MIDVVQCELALARDRLPADNEIRNWDAGFTLDLKAQSDGSVAFGTDTVFSGLPRILPSVGMSVSGYSVRSSTTQFTTPLKQISGGMAAACGKEDIAGNPTGWRLEGSLGVGEHLLRIASATQKGDDIAKTTGFSYGVEFFLKAGANGKLGIETLTSGGSFGPSFSKQESHKVVVAFAPAKDAEQKSTPRPGTSEIRQPGRKRLRGGVQNPTVQKLMDDQLFKLQIQNLQIR